MSAVLVPEGIWPATSETGTSSLFDLRRSACLGGVRNRLGRAWMVPGRATNKARVWEAQVECTHAETAYFYLKLN